MDISEDVKVDIITNLIEPTYKSDIREKLKLRKYFRRMGIFFETTSKVFVGASGVVSFSAGIYNYKLLAFLAGVFSTVSLVLLQFSSHAFRESKKETTELNNLLKTLNIQTIPEPIKQFSTDKFENSSDKS